MHPVHSLLPFLVCAGLAAGCASTRTAPERAASSPAIDYTVTVSDPSAETFEVAAVLRSIPGDTVTFHFPIWAPGAYDVVNYGAYVNSFTATASDGRALTVLRGDTNTFRIVGAGPETRLAYRVHDIESVPNSLPFCLSDIENDRAFANGTALFGYPEGFKEIPYTVTYVAPAGWSTEVALDPESTSKQSPWRYRARDYDELVDAPVQMGKFQRLGFVAKGKPHVITVTAPVVLDDSVAKALVDRTKRIVEIYSDFFGDMPYDRYLFQHYLVDIRSGHVDPGFGALEHRNSSSYRMVYFDQSSVVGILTPVIAHEYWHLWSPKRIHVSTLGPFDYQSPPHTSSLWFAEGLTEYYARLLLVRNELTSPAVYLGQMQRDMIGLAGREQAEPITELSLRVAEAPLTETIDLYRRGPLLGWLLDAEIRTQTANAKSLDDAMRYFNEQYGKTGKTFTDDEIIPIMERATGAKLAQFYARYIDGRDSIPFAQYLRQMGLTFDTERTTRRTLAATLERDSAGFRVASVRPGGSADSMGIRSGDIIVAIEYGDRSQSLAGLGVELFDAIVAGRRSISGFKVRRGSGEITVAAAIREGAVDRQRLVADSAAVGLPLAIRRSMLGF